MESGRPECLVLGLSGGLSLHFAVISFCHLSQKIGVPGGQVVGDQVYYGSGWGGGRVLGCKISIKLWAPVGAQRHNEKFCYPYFELNLPIINLGRP